LKVPAAVVVKLTVPVGVIGVVNVSVTVAVQVVAVVTTTGLGMHEAEAVVGWTPPTLTVVDPLPVECTASPP
jgi:hypothetical protein